MQTKDLAEGGAEGQAEQALKNMGAILKAAGADYKDVVKTTVLLADIADFGAVNTIYGELPTSAVAAHLATSMIAACMPRC
jgi:2-iminobutanoate/2-iminopropanoate deaminase